MLLLQRRWLLLHYTTATGFAVEEVSPEITLRQSVVWCFPFFSLCFRFRCYQIAKCQRTAQHSIEKEGILKLKSLEWNSRFSSFWVKCPHNCTTNYKRWWWWCCTRQNRWIWIRFGMGSYGMAKSIDTLSHMLQFIRFYAKGISSGLHLWGFDCMQKLMTMIV